MQCTLLADQHKGPRTQASVGGVWKWDDPLIMCKTVQLASMTFHLLFKALLLSDRPTQMIPNTTVVGVRITCWERARMSTWHHSLSKWVNRIPNKAQWVAYLCVCGWLRIKPTRNSCYGDTCTVVQKLFMYYCSHTSPLRRFLSEKALTVFRCKHWLTDCRSHKHTETSTLQNELCGAPNMVRTRLGSQPYGCSPILPTWNGCYIRCDMVQQLFKHCMIASRMVVHLTYAVTWFNSCSSTVW